MFIHFFLFVFMFNFSFAEFLMGNAGSDTKNNDELVDHLVNTHSIRTKNVERAMRLVDRGLFVLKEDLEEAYKDQVWKSRNGDPGYLHISAPCIYASVLENLDLKPGLSFLNVGSGTGYLSDFGTNHGVELYKNVVKYANEKIETFQLRPEVVAFGWKKPCFFLGNAFLIDTEMRYDRIYCGALVPTANRSFFCSLLKVNGILIMPYGGTVKFIFLKYFLFKLHRVIRKTETNFITNDISDVTFSNFILPTVEEPYTIKNVTIPLYRVETLMEICRTNIRSHLRKIVRNDHIISIRTKLNKKEQTSNNDRRAEPIIPINTTEYRDRLERRRDIRRRYAERIPFLIVGNPDEEEEPIYRENRRRFIRTLNRPHHIQPENPDAPEEVAARHLFAFFGDIRHGNLLNRPLRRFVNRPQELLRNIPIERLAGENAQQFQIAIEVEDGMEEDLENPIQIPHIMNDQEFEQPNNNVFNERLDFIPDFNNDNEFNLGEEREDNEDGSDAEDRMSNNSQSSRELNEDGIRNSANRFTLRRDASTSTEIQDVSEENIDEQGSSSSRNTIEIPTTSRGTTQSTIGKRMRADTHSEDVDMTIKRSNNTSNKEVANSTDDKNATESNKKQIENEKLTINETSEDADAMEIRHQHESILDFEAEFNKIIDESPLTMNMKKYLRFQF